MIAAILRRHGLRTGAYLSPHLVSFAERVRIDDADLVAGRFAAAVQRAAHAAELVDRTLEPDDRVTQFEALTAAAYSELAPAGWRRRSSRPASAAATTRRTSSPRASRC